MKVPAAETTGMPRWKSDVLSVALILEQSQKETSVSNHILQDLPRWLVPARSRVFLTQALAALPSGKLFLKDQEAFLKGMQTQEPLAKNVSATFRSILEGEGFEFSGEEVTDHTDTGCEEILCLLKTHPSDLVVLASTDPADRLVKNSSFLTTLASHVSSPVLFLRHPLKPDTSTLKVLLATDGSTAAETAARKLPELLNTAAMQVQLLHVQHQEWLMNPVVSPYINTTAVETAMVENGRMVLEMTRSLLENSGVSVADQKCVFGTPAWTVMEHVQRLAPDLVVVGAHNPKDIWGVLLGSVSSRLLQADTHNLLIVR